MQVLFATYAEKTHFFSMVPLAWALRTAGHEVRVASQPALTDTITRAGLTAVPVGRDHDIHRVLDAFPDLKRLVSGTEMAPFDRAGGPEERVTWEYLKNGYDKVVPWAFQLANDPMVDDLVGFCRQWRPDLVVWEPTTYAGAIAAEACGAAHARLTWSPDFYGQTRERFVRLRDASETARRGDPLREWLARRGAPFGVAVNDEVVQGDFTIEQLPEALRMSTAMDTVAMRFVAYNGAAVVPEWLRRPVERPRVALTLGVSAIEQLSGYSVSVAQVVEELASVEAEVVATVSEREQQRVGAVPPNVRMVSFVPLHALLPTCSAVIHHGGWGTVCTATATGVPQLILPQQLDAPFMADRIVEAGAGLSIPCTEANQVAASVRRLLEEPGFRVGAKRLQENMTAMPSPNQVADELERRTAQHQAQRPTGARPSAQHISS